LKSLLLKIGSSETLIEFKVIGEAALQDLQMITHSAVGCPVGPIDWRSRALT
jgi:hypothetical protein